MVIKGLTFFKSKNSPTVEIKYEKIENFYKMFLGKHKEESLDNIITLTLQYP